MQKKISFFHINFICLRFKDIAVVNNHEIVNDRKIYNEHEMVNNQVIAIILSSVFKRQY